MIEQEVRQIVRETVHETLTTLGLDVADPEAVLAAQADFAYLRRSRRGAEEIGKWIRRGAIGVAVTGFAALLWEGFKAALKASGAR